MTANELIKILQYHVKEHGDVKIQFEYANPKNVLIPLTQEDIFCDGKTISIGKYFSAISLID